MNKNKRFLVLLSFIVGTVMFATTAIADIASKSSYEQFKDSIKFTAESLTENTESFTIESAYAIKIDDFVLESQSSILKADYVNLASEDWSKLEKIGNNRENFFYKDKNGSINWNSNNDTYHVYEYNNPNYNFGPFDNPFKEKEAKDIERIIDALIGNLKDHVIAVKNEDGSKSFSGSLRESQIPTLINAVTSYFVKTNMAYYDYGYAGYGYVGNEKIKNEMPKLADNIYVVSIKGDAKTNEQGIINDLNASIILTGDDEDGQKHTLKLEGAFKISGINSTVVERPDLTGKKVEVKKGDRYGRVEPKIPQKYVGKWKKDIVIDENDSFEKIGERILEIKSIDSEYVYGEIHNEYKEGHEGEPEQFEFKARIMSFHHAIIELEDGTESNQKPEDVPEPERIERGVRVKRIEPGNKIGSIHFDNSIIRFHMNNSQMIDEPIFTRVFDE